MWRQKKTVLIVSVFKRIVAAGVLACAFFATLSWASSIPDNGIGDTDGVVNAILIADQTLYIGGSFSAVFSRSGAQVIRNNLAAIDLSTGNVTSWNPDVSGGINAMVFSTDGRALYVGGSFNMIGGVSRNNLAIIDTTVDANNVGNWDPDPDGEVHALSLAEDGITLYAGGAFTRFKGGSITRNNLASLHAVTGDVNPWSPEPDNIVFSLLPSQAGATIYVGGQFVIAGGLVRSNLAEIDLSSGQSTGWNPAPDGVVRILLQENNILYAGGDFTTIDGGLPGSRSFLAALDTSENTPGSMDTSWDPVFDGVVRALAFSYDRSILYVGGDFSTVNGSVPRSRLAAVNTAVTSNNATAWDPGAVGISVNTMTTNADRSTVYIGGDFTDITTDPGLDPRASLAAFAISPPVTTATPPGGSYPVSQSVTLSCLDNSGGSCTAIYMTADGSFPAVIPGNLYNGAPIAVSQNTTLKFFSVDSENNNELVQTADYFIDAIAPTSSASLPGGSYGIATLQSVELSCDDGLGGSGCSATYFTVDGSTPTTSSSLYRNPVDLAGLLPPSGAGQITLKFFSVDNAANEGVTDTEQYDLDLTPPVTSASLPDGMYNEPQIVTLTCDDGAGSGCETVYFTTDGSVPSDGTIEDSEGNIIPPSPIYTQPLAISGATTLNVFSVDKAGNKSAALVGIYSFTTQVGRGSSTGSTDPIMLLLLFCMTALYWLRLLKAWWNDGISTR